MSTASWPVLACRVAMGYTLVEADPRGTNNRSRCPCSATAGGKTIHGKSSKTAMKFFVDSAYTDEIRELAATGLVDGVTTNPSLIAKSGRRTGPSGL